MLKDQQEAPKNKKSESVQDGYLYSYCFVNYTSTFDFPERRNFLSLRGYPIGEHNVRSILEFDWLNDNVGCLSMFYMYLFIIIIIYEW